MTRMWLLPTNLMCRAHLLGEHSEMHQAAGTIENHPHGLAVMRGHCREDRPDDVETLLIVSRHDALAREMEDRGMDHDWDNELARFDDPGIGHIGHDDVLHNRDELALRCADCRSRMESVSYSDQLVTYAAFDVSVRPGWPDDPWAFREGADG